MAPDNTSTIERTVTAIGHIPHGYALLAALDFNTYLEAPGWNIQDYKIMAEMAELGLEDMSKHLLLC